MAKLTIQTILALLSWCSERGLPVSFDWHDKGDRRIWVNVGEVRIWIHEEGDWDGAEDQDDRCFEVVHSFQFSPHMTRVIDEIYSIG